MFLKHFPYSRHMYFYCRNRKKTLYKIFRSRSPLGVVHSYTPNIISYGNRPQGSRYIGLTGPPGDRAQKKPVRKHWPSLHPAQTAHTRGNPAAGPCPRPHSPAQATFRPAASRVRQPSSDGATTPRAWPADAALSRPPFVHPPPGRPSPPDRTVPGAARHAWCRRRL